MVSILNMKQSSMISTDNYVKSCLRNAFHFPNVNYIGTRANFADDPL